MTQRTLAIIKPDAVAKGVAGEILARIEQADFRVLALKLIQLTEDDAGGFDAVHSERRFFKRLCTVMTQGPCIPIVLERDSAIQHWRDLMGATDPAKAAAGTIRKDFAASIEANAVHGSDAVATASFEIPYFFSSLEICPR
jgi:nucleoside-diphosphate kinase